MTFASFRLNTLAAAASAPAVTPFLTLAVASQSSPFINVYNRNGDTFTKLSNPASLPSISGSQQHIAINHNGTSIAIGGGSSPYIHIYNRSGDTLTKLSNPGTLPPAEVHGIAWNHDNTSLVQDIKNLLMSRCKIIHHQPLSLNQSASFQPTHPIAPPTNIARIPTGSVNNPNNAMKKPRTTDPPAIIVLKSS